MTMTRQHFQAIADTLKNLEPIARVGDGVGVCPTETGRSEQWALATEAFADMCAQQNYRFDRGRFLAACGASDHE